MQCDVPGQTLFRSYGRLFAEFLEEQSLVRLGLLDLTTCVGLRYGPNISPTHHKTILSTAIHNFGCKMRTTPHLYFCISSSCFVFFARNFFISLRACSKTLDGYEHMWRPARETVRKAQKISDILHFPHRPLGSPHALSPSQIVFSQALEKLLCGGSV